VKDPDNQHFYLSARRSPMGKNGDLASKLTSRARKKRAGQRSFTWRWEKNTRFGGGIPVPLPREKNSGEEGNIPEEEKNGEGFWERRNCRLDPFGQKEGASGVTI